MYTYKRYGKTLHIYDPIYRENIWVLLSKDKRDYINLYKKWFKEMPENIDYDHIQARYSVGECYNDNIDIHIIWFKKYHPATLCHEILHCTRRILSTRGIDLSEYTDEAYAYYQEFLMKSIIDGFKIKG